jgi:DNA-binding transcriptional ArsR family regulator
VLAPFGAYLLRLSAARTLTLKLLSRLQGNNCVTVTVVLPSAGDPFEALGDETRREIVRLLSSAEMAVGEIAAQLPISRPAVSRHLRLLKNAGLVGERQEGTRRLYHLEAEGMEAVQSFLLGVWGDAATRFRLLADNAAKKRRS